SARRGSGHGRGRPDLARDVAQCRRARPPVRVIGYRPRVPGAGCALQGVGAGEPVRTQPAAPPLGPRLVSTRPYPLRNLRTLDLGLVDKPIHLVDADGSASRQVDDLELEV